MITRRQVLRSGLAAAALGYLGFRKGAALGRALHFRGSPASFGQASPLRRLPRDIRSTLVQGIPFAEWFTGDDFDDHSGYPFHALPPCCAGVEPPPATETVDVAVVGGGLSGLAAAYLLRDYRPVVLELHGQFGGNAAGETWHDTSYSMGSAYVIAPDPGSVLDGFYRELGLDAAARFAGPQDPVELAGQIDWDFWSGDGLDPADAAAFRRYAEVVALMAEENYPDIPPPEGEDNDWILELDRASFRADLEARMGLPLPPLLAAAVQGYFYSSFGAAMEDISAAAGWNFVAAEEYGRWVFPGGNAFMARALWERLARLDDSPPGKGHPSSLRANCMVADVRLRPKGVQVTWYDADQQLRSLLARFVVVACPKHVAKHIIHDLASLDGEKLGVMHAIPTCAYLVANVLLESPVELDWYDLFLLGGESFPVVPADFEGKPRVVDVINGHYARSRPSKRSVLTFYWPFPFGTMLRPTLLLREPWREYAELLAPQLREVLAVLGVAPQAVRQVRMSRWGHALPIARPGFIALGGADAVRRPIEDRIFFVNQDNWALPAVENSLLDAYSAATAIAAAMGRRPEGTLPAGWRARGR
jgi:hypothetical protein